VESPWPKADGQQSEFASASHRITGSIWRARRCCREAAERTACLRRREPTTRRSAGRRTFSAERIPPQPGDLGRRLGERCASRPRQPPGNQRRHASQIAMAAKTPIARHFSLRRFNMRHQLIEFHLQPNENSSNETRQAIRRPLEMNESGRTRGPGRRDRFRRARSLGSPSRRS